MEGHVRRDLRNTGQIGDSLGQGDGEGQTGRALGDVRQIDGADAQGIPQILQGQILDPPDGHIQADLLHIRGDQPGIYRLSLIVTEGVIVALADGFPPSVQIHGDGGHGNGIDHGLRARDRDLRVIQRLILPVDHKALGGGAYPDHLHRHGLADALDHSHIDRVRLLGLNNEGIAGYLTGESRGGIADGNLGAGFPDLRKIRLNGNVRGIDLAQVRTVAGQAQVHRIGGDRRDHQAVFIQDGFPLPDDGDVVIGIRGAGTYRGDDVQPKSEGNGQGQQHISDFTLHDPGPPFRVLPASAAGSGRCSGSPAGSPQDTGHCAAAFPASWGPDGA